MPSTPRAITIPKIVAQVMTANEVGWSFFDSTESCAVDAASCGVADLGGAEGLSAQHQPVRRGRLDVELLIACSVITVFGAEVPARQRTDLLDHRVGEAVGCRRCTLEGDGGLNRGC